MRKLRLGVIGLSEGNGHPYSWSAICNGYDPNEMANCPFQVIPEYLAEQSWPGAQIPGVQVSHIWTQDEIISSKVAKAALIPNIVQNLEDLIPHVDAVLLARDDPENHYQMARPLLKAGLPVFIDKPLSLSLNEAKELFGLEQYEGQLYTCSSLRFAKEFYLNEAERNSLGQIIHMEAQIPKSWEKYAIHILEPIIAANPKRGEFLDIKSTKLHGIVKANIVWENLTACISTYGNYAVPLEISYFNEVNRIRKPFNDTFNAFKSSIECFISTVKEKKRMFPKEETLEIVRILEAGLK